MRLLAIETSCDETAAAVVCNGRWIESSLVATQFDLHRAFGGIVPETAARAHLATLGPLVRQAMEEARVEWRDLVAVAVTHGPGLAGSLLVGVNVAKAICFAHDLPLVPVNHLEGHIYANWLLAGPHAPSAQTPPEPPFPLLCLIVSGGHTELTIMEAHGRFRTIGRTRDDAAGEAFDKVARLLGLGYPGGPAIEKAAEQGDPQRLPLPRAWLEGTYDFSLSGLKTAVARLVSRWDSKALPVYDVAASFQDSVVEVLATKTARAARQYRVSAVALAGGVAANLALRARVKELSPVPVLIPLVALCTDNAAAIGSGGYYRFIAGQRAGLDLDVYPNLSLA